MPLSTSDWPDQLAAVVFVAGCPWRCHYCHNPTLQNRGAGSPAHAWENLLTKLRGRQGLLDGVVFSGGEATIDDALPRAVRDVKALGLRVGLHTAGIYPRRLAAVLPEVDWVGFDVKADFSHYPHITGVPRSGEPVYESLQCLLSAGTSHEVRTTYHPALLDEQAMVALAKTLRRIGVRRWVLQPFRATAETPQHLGGHVNQIPPPLLSRLNEWVGAGDADGGLTICVR